MIHCTQLTIIEMLIREMVNGKVSPPLGLLSHLRNGNRGNIARKSLLGLVKKAVSKLSVYSHLIPIENNC